MTWFTYTLLSLSFFGIAYTLFKLPAMQNQNRFASTFWVNTFITLIIVVSALFFSPHSFEVINAKVMFLGLLWGMFFSLNMFFQMSALKKMGASTLFPIASSLSSILVVLIGFLFLSESISLSKILGIIVVLLSVYFFTRKNKEIILDSELIGYFSGILITSILVKYFQKVVIDFVQDPVTTVMVEYLGAGIFALIFGYIFYKNTFTKSLKSRNEIRGGLIISVPLLLGGFFIIQALKIGELSQIFSVHPAYVVVVALLASLFFKEKITWKKILIIFVIIVGVILIKTG